MCLTWPGTGDPDDSLYDSLYDSLPGQVLETRPRALTRAGGATRPVDVDGHVVTHGLDVAFSEIEIMLHSSTSIICPQCQGRLPI